MYSGRYFIVKVLSTEPRREEDLNVDLNSINFQGLYLPF